MSESLYEECNNVDRGLNPDGSDPEDVVTPVEERIDHAEALKTAEFWDAYVPMDDEDALPADNAKNLSRSYLALRGAAEDAVSQSDLGNGSVSISLRAYEALNAVLGLSATEPAQPEEER